MQRITGTLKIAGIAIDVNLVIEDDHACCGQCDEPAPSRKRPIRPEEIDEAEVKKVKAQRKEIEKKEKETPKADPPQEAPAVTVDQVTEAAVRIAEKGADHLAKVKEVIKDFSELGVPKVKTVPEKDLGDLLEALNNIEDEIQ